MATKIIAWNTGGGNITLTYQGQGDGTISVQSDTNNLGSARSQVITVETVSGAITRNITINQAACPFPVGDVRNFSYTGSYQEVELPAGQYKLQCWGAQGGSNAAASSYGITAQAGGKGGYSEGVITLTQKTTVRIYVGGQGSSSAGGFNGGGTTGGSSAYSSADELGVSTMGGGGGATDIRLSDGALLSRMIVAGGGSGGAMCYQQKTVSSSITVSSFTETNIIIPNDDQNHFRQVTWGVAINVDVSSYKGGTCTIKRTSDTYYTSVRYCFLKTIGTSGGQTVSYASGYTQTVLQNASANASFTVSIPSDANYLYIYQAAVSGSTYTYGKVIASVTLSKSSTTTSNDSQVGFVGGGNSGGGSGGYQGQQNAAGAGGAFGQGANQATTNYRYCSGAGGGGWYGGGGQRSDSYMAYIHYMGGGSGFVNTAASAAYRPSGYTGLELDSGETKDGNTSFPAPGGGYETGHAGNGYVRITRL